MLDSINLGKYIWGKSLVHKLHAVCKVLSLLMMIISIFFIDSYVDIIILTIYLFLGILYTGINIKVYLKNVFSIKIFILFVFIIDLVFFDSINRIIFDLFKLLFIVLYASLLTFTTTVMEITFGIEKILIPFSKIIPVRDIASIVTLTLRYIPLLNNEASRIIRAQKFRGIDFKSKNVRKKIEMISVVFVPIFTLSLERADKTADIMDLRLYNYSKSRTNYRQKKWRAIDTCLLILNIWILIIVIIY